MIFKNNKTKKKNARTDLMGNYVCNKMERETTKKDEDHGL